MGTDKVSYRSIEIERPTYTMSPGSKEITFNYFINADWTDYRALYNWCMNNAPVNKGANASRCRIQIQELLDKGVLGPIVVIFRGR